MQNELRAAAQQGLEALKKYRHMMFVEAGCRFGEGDAAITVLEAALAAPVQEADVPATNFGNTEPVGWLESPHGAFQRNFNLRCAFPPKSVKWRIPVYFYAPQPLAMPVQEPVAQISANRVIAAIEEWKSLWWKVPPFASKVNRATREAITVSHNPLFALLRDAQAAKQMPNGCTTPSGCQQHGCHGDCLPTEPQRPAEPVGVVTSMVKGGVTWRRWPADMPDGTLLFSEVQP